MPALQLACFLPLDTGEHPRLICARLAAGPSALPGRMVVTGNRMHGAVTDPDPPALAAVTGPRVPSGHPALTLA